MMAIQGLLRRIRGGSIEVSERVRQVSQSEPPIAPATSDVAAALDDIERMNLRPGSMQNGVLVGRDRTLFLAGGAHAVFEIVNGLRPIDEGSIDRFRANVERRATWAAARDIPYVHLLFPDKQSIVPNLWPLERCLSVGNFYLQRLKHLHLPIVYPDMLLRGLGRAGLSRVDTHVTAVGSIHVTAALAQALTGERDEMLVRHLLASTNGRQRRAGDLGSKLEPPVSAAESVFTAQAPGLFLTNGLTGGNNGLVDLRFNPDARHQKRCVLFGDSFGRDLCIYLQFWFSEVLFFRTGFFHADIAERLAPDMLITENVERYLDDCRSDADAPEFTSYLSRADVTYAPSEQFVRTLASLGLPAMTPLSVTQPKVADPDVTVAPPTAAGRSEAIIASAATTFPVAVRCAPIGGEDVIEAACLVPRTEPILFVDQSLTLPLWSQPAVQDIHSTLFARRSDVLLCGPSIQARNDEWWCESRIFGEQFIDMVTSASYRTAFPGPKPSMTAYEGTRSIDFNPIADEIEPIEEPLFLATPLEPANWGRWVSTVICKVEHFRQLGHGRRLFCASALPWQRALLTRLGIEEHELRHHDPGRAFRCRDIASVEYNVANMTVSVAERRRFQHLRSECTARVRAADRGRRFPERVFISRLGVSERNPHYRVLQNERVLLAALAALGFAAIEPETLSFDEQVATFGNAKLVACLGGAAVYNAVFCDAGASFLSIESSDSFLGPHASVLGSLNLRHGMIVGTQDPTDATPVHKRWTVDVDGVLRALRMFDS